MPYQKPMLRKNEWVQNGSAESRLMKILLSQGFFVI